MVNFEIFTMLEHDLEMACAKFQAIGSEFTGDIDEKHALQIYQNNCPRL